MAFWYYLVGGIVLSVLALAVGALAFRGRKRDRLPWTTVRRLDQERSRLTPGIGRR